MSELIDDIPIDAAPIVPTQGKNPLWIWGVIGAATVYLGVILAGTSLDYMYNVWPQDSYVRIYEQPWIGLNVRNLGFQNAADFAQARQVLEKKASNSREKDSLISHYLLAELYNSMNQPQKAMPHYQMVIKNADSSWLKKIKYQQFVDNAHASLAILYYEQGKGTRAEQEINQIAKTDENRDAQLLATLKDSLEEPERGDFHLLLGKEFRKELKLGMASKELQQAETLSQSPQLRMEAANFIKTQMPQGVKDLSPLARYYGLAARSAQTNDENLPKAATLFQKALQENPKFDWGYNELAIIYREMKDYPKATAYAKDAIAQNPDFYNPYLTLGDIALDQEDYNAAIIHFQAAKAILQHHPLEEQQMVLANIENQVAYAYETLGDTQEAIHHYQSALNLATDIGDTADEDYNYAQDGLARVAEFKQENAKKSAANKDGKQLSWRK